MVPSPIAVPPTNRTIVLPADVSCPSGLLDGRFTKQAVALLFWLKEEVVPSVPTVLSVDTATSRTNVSITASVLSTAAGGTLYCGAYRSSSLPPITRSLIKSSGYSVPVAQESVESTVHLTIRNLVAATSYNVYCHIEDALGNRGSLESVIELETVVSTPCCREIEFHETINYVTASTSIDSQYTFKYGIAAFPKVSQQLTVVAHIEDSEGNVPDGVHAYPSSATFNSGNRNNGLYRSFVIFADSSLASGGTYSVRLEATGTASSSYSVPAAQSFEVLVNANLVPGPNDVVCNIFEQWSSCYGLFRECH